MTSGLAIRPARDEDWERIWPFYGAIVRAGETYALPDPPVYEEARALWMTTAEQASAPFPAATVVAVDTDDPEVILGTAHMGPNRPGRGAHVANASFMVAPDVQGRGVGRALGEYALAWAREAGYRAMQFNAVVETNTAAVHLWQSLGFRVLCTVPGAFYSREHGYVGLHILYQSL